MAKTPEININYKVQYYVFQILGWGGLMALIALFNRNETGFSWSLFLFLTFVFIGNIAVSHFYRLAINEFNWLNNKIQILILKILGASFLLGIVFSVLVNLSSRILTDTYSSLIEIGDVIFGAVIYFIWSLLYVFYLLFYKARREEYKNMQLLTLSTEAELKNLRSQLNPHFMFNAMNSIKALIDENPSQSKEAVTKLSNVLRNSLIHSKKKEVTLSKELKIVNDYLSLEKIRYEERLEIKQEINPNTLTWMVPPLLLQTLVENAIKHGISKLIKGGVIFISARIEQEELIIEIINTGKLSQNNKSETSIGIENTLKRLQLKYGNKARFELFQEKEEVVARISIPKK